MPKHCRSEGCRKQLSPARRQTGYCRTHEAVASRAGVYSAPVRIYGDHSTSVPVIATVSLPAPPWGMTA